MHLEVHRASDGGDEYVCHLCPKKFKSKSYLQKHLERHENKRRRKKKKKEGEVQEQGDGVCVETVLSSVEESVEVDHEMDSNGEGIDGACVLKFKIAFLNVFHNVINEEFLLHFVSL